MTSGGPKCLTWPGGVLLRKKSAAYRCRKKIDFRIFASTYAEFHAEFSFWFLASERCRNHLKLVILYFFHVNRQVHWLPVGLQLRNYQLQMLPTSSRGIKCTNQGHISDFKQIRLMEISAIMICTSTRVVCFFVTKN